MTEKQRVHLVGIGGSGMSPLAKILVEKGWQVSGSDLRDTPTTRHLSSLGVSVKIGHHQANLTDPDLVVISSAIDPDNPEVVAAEERGIPVIHRSELLARMLNSCKGIAISGAHGKTTITSMVALILDRAGLDPTVVIGGELAEIGGGARSGEGQYLVAEADESDRSFLRYRPYIAVISNIEADHLENYNGQFSQVVEGFAQFMRNVKEDGLVIVCIDDPVLREITPHSEVPVFTYGFGAADYQADQVQVNKLGGNTFTVFEKGAAVGSIELRVPGRHNVANALAAIAVARQVGVDWPAIRSALREFHGAKRRFQFIGEVNDILIVDDYAHHPTEIMATLRAAKEGWNRKLFAVFQPHRYSRTHYLFKEFTQAFDLADETIIANIYSPPPDHPIPGVTAAKLAAEIAEHTGRRVVQIDDKAAIIEYLLERIKPGDMVITMGAGDIWQVAEGLANSLKKLLNNAVG